MLALMALDVKPGDAILCPSFTFAATAEVIPSMGAVPVFVDIDPATFNIDPDSIKEGIVAARNLGLTPKGIIAVDLYGLPADYDSIGSIASENNMWVIADSAQSFGAKYKGKRTGSIADITTTSFFPAKPLGGYGDGGAVFCRSDEVFSVLRSLRVHGMGSDRYDIVRIGMNGRLDSIQAAVLLEKLDIFEEEAGLRQEIADFYSEHLCDFVEVPTVPSGYQSIWALYTVKIPQNIDRSLLKSTLEKLGVPTMVYYPIPLHRQVAYKSYPRARGILKNSDSLSSRVLSLPMHPYLTRAEQLAVVNALKSELARIELST
jgi:dTDP-4-amino-4,6-dideoxygalactose transaminase